MSWVLPWLQALGLLAVVFGIGTAAGFGLSFLFGRRPLRRKRPRVVPDQSSS